MQPDGSEIRFTYDSDDRLSKIWSMSSETENANTISYDSGEVKKLNQSGNCEIEYIYDNKRRPATIKIGGIVFETYEYEENVMSDERYADRMTVINAKGERFCVEAEKYGMFEKAYYNDGLILEREYDNNGRLKKETDYLTNTDKSYVYDSLGNVIKYISGGNEERITYNYRGEISEIKYIGEVERIDKFTYKDYAIDYITAMETGMYKVNPLRDVTGRYTGKSVNIGNSEVDSESVEYRTSEKYLTHIPEKIIYKDTTLTYGYDVNGNISEISKNGELQTRYKYDSIGRLIREDNKVLNTSTTYKYDNNGNIVERKRGAYTLENEVPEGTKDTYIYYSDGRLQSYNGKYFGYERTYNPTTYLGKTMSWTRGRKLSLYNGTSFEYDGLGRRIKKNDIEYSYDGNGRLIKQSDGLEYYYDTTGLLGFSYKNISYVYRKDIQGNIIGILDNIGRVVVEYNYDAWGRHTVSGSNVTLGNKNPFRYRGYYYDTETELYYLQSRYYDPKLCRFINMDSIEYAEPERINGLNLFAYCNNNPVMFVDPSGTFLREIGSWFKKLGNDIKNFFVNDYYDKVIKPTIEWVDSVKTEVVGWLDKNIIQPFNNFRNHSTIFYSQFKRLLAYLPNGGPYINPDAEGWGENGEFTDFQKAMGIVAGIGFAIGTIGAFVRLVPTPKARIVGSIMFGVGFAVSIFALILGGLGGAT